MINFADLPSRLQEFVRVLKYQDDQKYHGFSDRQYFHDIIAGDRRKGTTDRRGNEGDRRKLDRRQHDKDSNTM